MTFLRFEHKLYKNINSSCAVLPYSAPHIICYITCFNAQGDRAHALKAYKPNFVPRRARPSQQQLCCLCPKVFNCDCELCRTSHSWFVLKVSSSVDDCV